MILSTSSIQYLKGIGEKRAKHFARLGIFTVGDLLQFYPRAYEDWSNPSSIADAAIGENCCVKATCLQPVNKFVSPKTRIKVFSTVAGDGESTMEITFFNNPYAADKLKIGEEYLFFGRVEGGFISKKMVSPTFSVYDGSVGLKPVYRQTHNLNSNAISKAVKTALSVCEDINEPFPAGLMASYNLISHNAAISAIHFPKDNVELQAAKDRLAFEKLLYLRLGLLMRRLINREDTGEAISADYTKEFKSLLPYKLTNAQQRVISEAIEDLKDEHPMSRLVQGDVGSGKTAVAASLIYTAAKNGMQSAMMAPTEILAEQHFAGLSALFNGTDINLCLLTGSLTAAQKRAAKEKIKSGEADVVIGTHALIQKDVEFNNLCLIIADEQHRFGVKQRSALVDKGKTPNLLVMSATPIPRTLSMIMYGDLDISIIDELPAGRQEIKTYRITSDYHDRIYDFIKSEVLSGRQAYIVCPLVDENEESELISATDYAESLRDNAFADYKIGLLHGKMKNSEKDSIMRSFKNGEIQILVATTVIEVGIDVPNATIMVIENAERFGLSQLHQLRGRIGRGSHKSYCVLISDATSAVSKKRFDIMCETRDGFKIAEADYNLRGPGEFFGESQHGFGDSGIAELLGNTKLLKQSTEAAEIIINADPHLDSKKYSGLREETENLFKTFNLNDMN